MVSISFIFNMVLSLFFVTMFVAPTVLLFNVLSKLTKGDKPSISPDRIAALEQNDNIIVEDINNALTDIGSRLEAIEERLDKEDSTIKGFKK